MHFMSLRWLSSICAETDTATSTAVQISNVAISTAITGTFQKRLCLCILFFFETSGFIISLSFALDPTIELLVATLI